ncbi:MAG: cyclic nucleotide-binding domain-containing protein [Candidatus Ozemobacteraceae bacterium]
MLPFHYGNKRTIKAKTVIYSQNSKVSQKAANVLYLLNGKAMIARKIGDKYFRMGLGENMIFGLQDSFSAETRITTAISLEDIEVYCWDEECFFRNVGVDIQLARMATYSLCRELRFLNDCREKSFSEKEETAEDKFVVNEDMQMAGLLYNLAFNKGSEEIPEEITKQFGKTYNPGEVIITENDKSDEIYILVEGTVEVSKGGKTICTVPAGEIFGEMSHFENKPRAATIKAVDKLKVLCLEPKNFNVLYQLHPNWSFNLIKSLCRRIKNAYLAIKWS